MVVRAGSGVPWPRVSVVIPTLNEARNLPHVFSRLPADLHEVIVVDGHSVDDTPNTARRLRPGVRTIMQSRTGKGNALACGFAAATGDVIVMLDADGSADPREIPQFVQALLAGADFAKGSRFAAGGGSSDITRLRQLGNRALVGLVNVSYGTNYSDLCYGFNAFWRRHLPALRLDAITAQSPDGDCRLWGDGFEIETIIHLRMAAAGLVTTEVPSFEYPRIHGVSNLHAVSDGLRVLRTIVKERLASHDLAAASGRPRPARHGTAGDAGAREVPDRPGRRSSQDRVVVIGSGWRFASGISHYTYRLSCALADEYPVGTLLMRRLVPRRLYPGRNRVGARVVTAAYPAHIPVYDGVDWYWGRSLSRALRYLDQQRPTVVVLEWWSGAVLHTYLRLARYAARHGASVILEWHEGQDTGEAEVPGAHRYVQSLMPRLLSGVDAHVVHSDFDLRAIKAAFTLGDAPVRVIPHGPYDHLIGPRVPQEARLAPHGPQAALGADGSPFRLLYLGVVRPFKGVEDLVTAFSGLGRDQAVRFRLCVVGETWEGWTAPAEAIARSPHSDLIERVDRYVTDAEVAAFFGQADAVVLPYHRSSSSGPLHIAMSAGLPVVTTAVGGLIEAVERYPGAILVPPRDPVALRQGLLRLLARRGQRYPDPHSWARTTAEYRALIGELNKVRPGGGG
jgi:glycosyltransferase involved in cell wall biosynthesis